MEGKYGIKLVGTVNCFCLKRHHQNDTKMIMIPPEKRGKGVSYRISKDRDNFRLIGPYQNNFTNVIVSACLSHTGGYRPSLVFFLLIFFIFFIF